MTIKLLSNSTINKIAAGEVIERPSSVVKELVENSIDAGATKIEINLECAGKNLITIKDDGSGMTKEDLELAIQRHATSKLDEEDLLNINSFGFRGEALPSIGAISKFKITSKKRGTDTAHSLSIIGGEVEKATVTSSNEGTIIEVRDLFFATPARLKFLRSDRTELNASLQIVKKIAIAHPEIAFTLTHDGKELIKVRRQNGTTQENLKNRIEEIIGSEFIENAERVDFTQYDRPSEKIAEDSSTGVTAQLPSGVTFQVLATEEQVLGTHGAQNRNVHKVHEDSSTGVTTQLPSEVRIYGYTSLPTYNRASADDQFLFINNRPVKDKILNIALKVAYQDYLARDRHPVTVLFLKINPQFVDVNVHPAKTEVRFHDPNLIRGLVISAIKEALRQSSNRVATTPSAAAINYIEQTTLQNNNNFRERTNYPSKSSFVMNRPSATPALPRPDYALIQSKPHSLMEAHDKEDTTTQPEVNLSSLAKFPLGAAKAQLHGTYIISQTEDSIVITDQHAAHERIGYEKIKKQIEKDGLLKQRLLMPEIVELPDAERADLLNDNKEKLGKLGLTIEKFGDKSIIVSEIPSLVGDINPSQIISDVSDYLASSGENIALTELIEHVTETYACHYAIRAGRKLGAEEMNELLRQMEETPFSGQCNHGRQTYVELKLKDIEKLFGRK